MREIIQEQHPEYEVEASMDMIACHIDVHPSMVSQSLKSHLLVAFPGLQRKMEPCLCCRPVLLSPAESPPPYLYSAPLPASGASPILPPCVAVPR